jgi:hypothetical protein
MWIRGLPGLVICALGVVWFLQGVNVLHGSGMSGHHQYAVLGQLSWERHYWYGRTAPGVAGRVPRANGGGVVRFSGEVRGADLNAPLSRGKRPIEPTAPPP